jgi:glycosyltransferase involved in cell wall biosynthesis
MLGAFERQGWDIKRFIVGDRLPPTWTASGSQRAMSATFARRLTADIVRLVVGQVNARRARTELQGKVDLVYERFGAFQALGAAFRRDGIPWILETNGPLFYEAKVERRSLVLSGIARRLELAAYRECDLLVCISDELKRIIVEACDVPSSKVLVVPNGVDAAFFDPGKYQPTRRFEDFTVGFVGNLYPWAGLDLLFEAVADLRADGLPVSIMVVGDGMLMAHLKEKAQTLGIAPYVAFTGRLAREEVPSYILGSEIGYSGQTALQLGTMYHSPLKIYEYMALSRPVLASAFADALRVIREGDTGFLFLPSDKESLKAAIRKAYAARSEIRAMGDRARADVVAHHDWTARLRPLVTAVDRLLSAAGPDKSGV